ncbi:MAG: hypothetical protein WC807_09605 [Hyphomicrobium sp.]|jgi:hypothetical protein
MTTLRDHLESLRAQVELVEAGEMSLIQELGRALARADDALLDEVRRLASVHEHRRRLLVSELTSLAVRLGQLPAPLEPASSIEPPPMEHRYATRDADGNVQRLVRTGIN